MQRESQQFTGAPVSFIERVRAWLLPTGGAIVDGVRLAAINLAVLIGAFVLLGLMTFIDRAAGWLIPLPLLLPGFFVVLLTAAACLWVDWRYAEAHERATLVRGLIVQPDRFGVVAAAPFIVLAVMLVGTGMLGMAWAVVTLSGSRFVDAIGQIGYGTLFAALSLAVVFVARAATD